MYPTFVFLKNFITLPVGTVTVTCYLCQ